MTDQTTAPTGVVSSTELGLLNEWADASCTRFVCRSHGLQTTDTVSRDDLLQLVRAAMAAERERWADAMRAIMHSPAGAQALDKLEVGQGTNTPGGRAWLDALRMLEALPNTEGEHHAK